MMVNETSCSNKISKIDRIYQALAENNKYLDESYLILYSIYWRLDIYYNQSTEKNDLVPIKQEWVLSDIIDVLNIQGERIEELNKSLIHLSEGL